MEKKTVFETWTFIIADDSITLWGTTDCKSVILNVTKIEMNLQFTYILKYMSEPCLTYMFFFILFYFFILFIYFFFFANIRLNTKTVNFREKCKKGGSFTF